MKLKRDVEAARKAFKNKDVSALIKSHSKHEEIHDNGNGKYLKSWVYGGLDGIITTFAVVAGVAGAALSSSVVLILGFANLIGDGISMAMGDYLSTKSEREYYKLERSREMWEVDNHPKGEVEEMMEIYSKKGLNKKESKTMVEVLKKNKDFWVDTMMAEELGLIEGEGSPAKHGLVTFASFLIFGFIPLILYVIGASLGIVITKGFFFTAVLAGVAMFALGSLKTKITGKNWIRSGLETLAIGAITAGAAYFIGDFLASIL